MAKLTEVRCRSARRLSGRASFAVLVTVNVVLMASTSAPSPLYPLYQQRWNLSVTVLTVVFAVYVVGLVGALLTVGSLSDQLGRRPVLVVSVVAAAAGSLILWTAHGVVALMVARVVQGVATGTATGALSAGLVDFSPQGHTQAGPTMTAAATSFGLAVGGGVAGLLVSVRTHPDEVIFGTLTLVFVVLAVLLGAIPETAQYPTGRACLRPRIRIPEETRRAFRAAIPAIVAGWSTTGFFLALAPSLVRDVLHVGFGAAGGLSITALFLANSVGGLWAARWPARAATLLGVALLSVGAAGLAAALVWSSAIAFIGGSLVCGLAVGMTFNGTLRDITAATPAGSRAEVLSAAFVISYLALGLPSVAAGLTAPLCGLRAAGYGYTAVIAALSGGAAIAAARWHRLTP